MSGEKKTAFVTGANRGIGLEVCRQLGGKGFRVFAAGRDPAALREACDALKRDGVEAEPILIDLSDPASIDRAAVSVAASVRSLDALVNNAGVLLDKPGQGLDVSASDFQSSFRINAVGPFLLSRALLPLLEKSPSPQIVNLSTGLSQSESLRFSKDYLSYRVSKAALNAITMILASELASRRVSVNAACPGWVRTRMGGEGASRSPAEGADTVVWLASGGAEDSGGFYRDRKIIPW